MKKLSVEITPREKLWGWIYLVAQLFALPVILVGANQYFHFNLNEAAINFLLFAVNFTCVSVIFRNFIVLNSKIAMQKPLSILGSALVCYILYLASSALISAGISRIDPSFYNVNDSYISSIAQQDYPLIFIGTALLVPLTEEVLYRGLIFAGLYNRSKLLAYTLSTLFFAVLHILAYIGSYSPLQLGLCLLQYLPAGICFGWAYAKTDSIWTPVLIHMINNTLAVLTMR